MSDTNPLAEHYAGIMRERTAAPDLATNTALNELLRSIGRWRSRLIANTILRRDGPTVQGGPFRGMTYIDRATEGCLAPRLLGSYESELHPHIEAFIAAEPDAVIDIGCAEGYYAVGLAMRTRRTRVFARDIDPRARAACAEMAEKNGVADRIVVGGAFAGADFAAFEGQSVLVLMDAEGFEDELLKPDAWPALRRMSLIVETHESERPGVIRRLANRFRPTHHVELVDHAPRVGARPAWLRRMGHLDQLIAIWEWRAAPTPWLVMRPK